MRAVSLESEPRRRAMATIEQGATPFDIAKYLGSQQPWIHMEWKIRYNGKAIIELGERV